MVVPLSLDPGHNDPRSPLYSGPRCGECNTPTSTPVRRCESCRKAREAEAKAQEHRTNGPEESE
jgi:hypothetical protein